MAAQLFDCTVPLKVFSFEDNTDYGRIPRVSEAPFQRVTHFRSLLYFNQTTTLDTGHFLKEFQGVSSSDL